MSMPTLKSRSNGELADIQNHNLNETDIRVHVNRGQNRRVRRRDVLDETKLASCRGGRNRTGNDGVSRQ